MKWRDDPKPGWLVTMKYWWENFNRTPPNFLMVKNQWFWFRFSRKKKKIHVYYFFLGEICYGTYVYMVY